jgi:hypothetical protein
MVNNEKRKAPPIKIKVNGKEVSLNPFSSHILGNTIWAMISSLKLEEKPNQIEIELFQ